jgi:hypothetical protein
MKVVVAALVAGFVGAQMIAPTPSLADVLKGKIDGYNEDIFITTAPDTNSNDGQYARLVSRPASATEPLLSPTAWGLTCSLN